MKKMLRSVGVLLSLLLLVASSVWSQGLPVAKPAEVGLSAKRLERIGPIIQGYVDQNKIAGAVTLIARNGKVAYLKVYGMRDIEAKQPMAVDTMFRIASMTKPITSVAVMMLQEEGKLLLNDPISKYIPEFKNPNVLVLPKEGSGEYTTVPAKREITIRQLLSHTSGLTYTFWGKKPWSEIYQKAGISDGLIQTEGRIGDKMKILAGLPLMFHPGEGWEYSLSIDVLGYLVEVVSGKTLDEFFRERIFKPLRMKDTHFFIPEPKIPRLASLYTPDPQGGLNKVEGQATVGDLIYSSDFQYRGPKTYFSGGGGLVSTVSDYARFAQMLLNGGELDGVRLLSRKTVEQMTINNIGDLYVYPRYRLIAGDKFGLGFCVRTEKGQYDLTESLGTYTWSGIFCTRFLIDPKEKLISIILTQLYPFAHLTLQEQFRVLTYQAISN
jgi:CubicO group peptidase (beta-lactamase class C family)